MYSQKAKDEGWADVELIEGVERDMVETGVNVSWDDIADLNTPKQVRRSRSEVTYVLRTNLNLARGGTTR